MIETGAGPIEDDVGVELRAMKKQRHTCDRDLEQDLLKMM